jgi:hypothetical protein
MRVKADDGHSLSFRQADGTPPHRLRGRDSRFIINSNTPFITYTLATKLDVSGPLAEVVAGLLVCPLKGGPP